MPDSQPSYPVQLEIVPLTTPPQATVRVPGSKSITNRALVLAALAGTHSCSFPGALRSEDTEIMMDCLRQLGFEVIADWSQTGPEIFIPHPERGIQAKSADLF